MLRRFNMKIWSLEKNVYIFKKCSYFAFFFQKIIKAVVRFLTDVFRLCQILISNIRPKHKWLSKFTLLT